MKQKTAWEITDEFWEAVKDLLVRNNRDENKRYKRKAGGGRKPKDFRIVLQAIFYVLRTGIQWKALPKEFGSSSAVHRYFQLWSEKGIFLAMWRRGLGQYNELKGIQWEWQSIDGSMVKAPLAREEVGPNPTDRGKKWEQTTRAGRRGGSTACDSTFRSECT
jgi:transposase